MTAGPDSTRGGALRPAPSRAALKRYAEVIALWCARFDTAEIAARCDMAEAVVARFVANFRDVVRGEA